jgi:hypothetical protein
MTIKVIVALIMLAVATWGGRVEAASASYIEKLVANPESTSQQQAAGMMYLFGAYRALTTTCAPLTTEKKTDPVWKWEVHDVVNAFVNQYRYMRQETPKHRRASLGNIEAATILFLSVVHANRDVPVGKWNIGCVSKSIIMQRYVDVVTKKQPKGSKR